MRQTSTFDLAKPMYEGIFGDVITEISYAQQSAGLKSLKELEATRTLHPTSGLHFYAVDIAALPEAKETVKMTDFQFLNGTERFYDNESKILGSMDRIRAIMSLSSILSVPYDPISYRVPLVRLLYPANVEITQLRPYRKFERDIYDYISQVVGRSPALRLPLAFNIVIKECKAGSPDDIIRVALQLRDDSRIKSLRSIFNEFLNVYQEIDLAKMAQVIQGLDSEVEKFKKVVGSEFFSNIDMKIKIGWLPLDISFDIKKLLARLRHRKTYAALSNLATLTRQTFQPLLNVRNEINRVLGTNITDDVLIKLPP